MRTVAHEDVALGPGQLEQTDVAGVEDVETTVGENDGAPKGAETRAIVLQAGECVRGAPAFDALEGP